MFHSTRKRDAARVCIPHSTLRTPHSAFTLVELLVVMAIMGILASIVLFALAGVTESAKFDKTKATIEKLSTIVMAKYESYRTRRAPITIPAGTIPRVAAQWRVDAIRELMRLEMPDRLTDITDDPVIYATAGASTGPRIPRPSVSTHYKAILASNPSATSSFQGAKCLYLFVSTGTDDPDVMEQFRPDEFGVDSDGMKYFIDGWGKPIGFLRWAPGFPSPLQPWNVNATDPLGNPNTKVYPTAADPFDPMGVYKPASGEPFYNPAPNSAQMYPPLYPLIYSPGPDGIYDLVTDGAKTSIKYSTTTPPNNPYYYDSGGMLGTPQDLPSASGPPNGEDNSIDNVTNHDLGEK
jgi:prepilin-type N-terminal cleavage/methylation domain-containing protein